MKSALCSLISIIVPVYKVEPYLERCLQSLCNQSYNNIEIILVDDGSPDGCPAICDEWGDKEPRITVIHQNNQGLSAARNIGMEHSHGEYLMFVDSDDFVEPDYVEKLYETVTETGSDMAVAGYFVTTEAENGIVNERAIFSGVEAILAFEQGRTGGYFFCVVWNKIYKKSLFENIRFPIGKLNEDSYVMPYLYYRCNQIAIVDLPLYHYLYRDTGICCSQKEKLKEHQLLFKEEIEIFYKKINIKELILLHQIHLYSTYMYNQRLDRDKKRRIQRTLRNTYLHGKYTTKISLLQKIKFLVAVISIPLYDYVAVKRR